MTWSRVSPSCFNSATLRASFQNATNSCGLFFTDNELHLVGAVGVNGVTILAQGGSCSTTSEM